MRSFHYMVALLLPLLLFAPKASAQGSNPSPLTSIQLQTGDELWAVAWSPDSQLLAVAGSSGASVYTRTLQQVSELKGHTDRVYYLAWNPNSQQLATAARDGHLRIWNRHPSDDTFSLYKSFLLETQPSLYTPIPAWSPDGTRLAVMVIEQADPYDSSLYDGQIHFWETTTWKRLQIFPQRFQRAQNFLVWSPDGSMLVAGGNRCVSESFFNSCPPAYLSLISAVDGSKLRTKIYDFSIAQPDIVVWSRNNKLTIYDEDVTIYSVPDLEVIRRFDFVSGGSSLVVSLAWSPDETELAIGFEDGDTVLMHYPDAIKVVTLDKSDKLAALDWSADSSRLAIARANGRVEVWDVSSLSDVSPENATDEP